MGIVVLLRVACDRISMVVQPPTRRHSNVSADLKEPHVRQPVHTVIRAASADMTPEQSVHPSLPIFLSRLIAVSSMADHSGCLQRRADLGLMRSRTGIRSFVGLWELTGCCFLNHFGQGSWERR